MAIRDGNSSGTLNGIYQSIFAISHGNMVNPNIAATKDGNAITITLSPETIMCLRISDHPTLTNHDVKDLDPMDDDVLHKLHRDASTLGNVNIDTSSINGLVAVHDELLLEGDEHASSKDDPQRAVTRDRVAERAGFRVHHIIVGGIGDHVEWSTFASNGVSTEALDAICELLAIVGPIGVTPPTPVDGVCGYAWTVTTIFSLQVPS